MSDITFTQKLKRIDNLFHQKCDYNILDLTISPFIYSLLYFTFILFPCCPRINIKKTFTANNVNSSVIGQDIKSPPKYISPTFNSNLSNQGKNTIFIKTGGKYLILPKADSFNWKSYLPAGVSILSININIFININNTYSPFTTYAISTIQLNGQNDGLYNNPSFIYQIEESNNINRVPLTIMCDSNITFKVQLYPILSSTAILTDENFVTITMNKFQLEFIKVS